MKIHLAKHSGFCMGVRNAVWKIVTELNSDHGDIYVYGPLIHNPQTVDVLQRRGLHTIDSLDNAEGKQIAIRSHGSTYDEYKFLKQNAKSIINCTCPRVAQVQAIIKKYSDDDFFIIILGDKEHAEVLALKSYAQHGFIIVSDKSDINDIPEGRRHVVVAQTTLDAGFFEEIIGVIKNKFPGAHIINTICESTRYRQDDVIEGINKGINTLVVVGGKNSANTRRLASIGGIHGIKTIHVETEEELRHGDFSNASNILVTAGASTPGWIINNVLEKLYSIKYRKSSLFAYTVIKIIEAAVRTNVITAVAAFAFSLITQRFMKIEMDYSHALISFLFIFVMYSINNYFDKGFLLISNPYKYKLYDRYGMVLMVLSVIAMLVIVPFAARFSWTVIAIISLSFLFGSIYSSKPMKGLIQSINIAFIKQVYNSRLIASFGWLIIVVLLPVTGQHVDIFRLASISILLFTIIFLRQNLADIIAFQGDLILGKETLPILIGLRKSVWLSIVLSIIAMGVFSYAAVEYNYLWLLFNINIIYYIFVLNRIYYSDYVVSLKYEIIVDSNLILALLFFAAIIFYT